MTAASDFAKLRTLPVAAAIDYMRTRADLTVTHNWQDLWHEEHARQFTVSRLARLDLLQSVHNGITRSVQGDLSRRDWMRDTEQLLANAGWWGEKQLTDPSTGEVVKTVFNPARLALIFDTNTRHAYVAGQWQRIVAAKRTHPYLRYVTRDDDRVRPQHRAWHNVVLSVDDSFWHTHYPPNGWRCRCRVVPVSQQDYERGYSTSRPGAEYDSHAPTVREPFKKTRPPAVLAEHTNRRTGEITQVPSGIDPGFAYNAGQAREQVLAQMAQIVQAKLQAADKALAAAALRHGLISEQAFAKWLKNPQGEIPLAVLSEADAKALNSNVRIAVLSPDTLAKQLVKHPELLPEEYLAIQLVIDRATNKVQEAANKMIYIQEIDGDATTGGYVLVVKATKTGDGLFLTSLRRLSRDEAQRDSIIARLLKRKK